MLFCIHTVSKPGSEATIQELVHEHRAYLKPKEPDIHLGGPLLDKDDMSRIGGLLVMEFESYSEADLFFRQQPYAKAGIIENIVIHPFVSLIERGVLLDT